jgi:hypothetical protein
MYCKVPFSLRTFAVSKKDKQTNPARSRESKKNKAMKTTLNPRVVLVFLLLSSLTYQVQAAMTSEQKVVKAARFENTWIPSIELKEVEISAPRSESKIFGAVEYQGDVIPSIQMNEVTINASGKYDDNDIPAAGFIEPERSNYLTGVTRFNGEYIPVIQLNEVQIEAYAKPVDINAQDVNSDKNQNEGILQVNARQTFNVLIEFVISKTLEIVRHLIPSSGS